MGKGLCIVITAGPTREAIDPVRFISNRSTGVMGYEIAAEVERRGHYPILISGPVNLPLPKNIKCIFVETCLQMKKAVEENFKSADCLIMSAAVADYYVENASLEKMKKQECILNLKRNPDILAEMGRKKEERIIVGFTVETEDLRRNMLEKIKKKNLDLLVGTYILPEPFGDRRVSVIIMHKDGKVEEIGDSTKREIAVCLLDRIEAL